MRNRRIHREYDERKETKRLIYISGIVTVIAIITFIITYLIYSNNISQNIKTGDVQKLTEYSNSGNQIVTETNSSIGKSINQINNEEKSNNNEEKNETEKIAINTSNIDKQNKEEKDNNINTQEDNIQEDTKQVQTNNKVLEEMEDEVKDPTFIKPVNGEIIKEFAKDNLIYSETLKEWVTHNGIDIKADKTTIVKASADGKVKSIKTDPRYGITVVIEHVNGFMSIYSNLMTAEFVKENEEVKQGQTIGTVGNTAIFEILDESHLHFEILKDNEYLNPSDYI